MLYVSPTPVNQQLRFLPTEVPSEKLGWFGLEHDEARGQASRKEVFRIQAYLYETAVLIPDASGTETSTAPFKKNACGLTKLVLAPHVPS